MKNTNQEEKETKKKKKRRAESEEKNPLHREYGVFSNVRFIIGKMQRFDKGILILMILSAIGAPFYHYLWTFLSKFVIDVITGESELDALVGVILAFASGQLVITMLRTYFNSEIWWRLIMVRMFCILELNKKAMTVDFEHLEDTDVMDCHQKAQNAAGNNNDGVEGMMHQIQDCAETTTIVIAGLIILGTMNIYLVLAMLVLACINVFVSNYINKTAKAEVWDKLATWWRKQGYMDNITTDFGAAKDIRMFGLRPWLLMKYRELNLIRYDAEKKNAKLWSVMTVTGAVLWIVCQAGTYAWLVYAIINRGMTIGNFSLYLASTATFFNYVTQLFNQIVGFLAKSRQVDDFRSFLDFPGGDDCTEGKEVPKADHYEFTFENVSFRYPKAEHDALKNLNLTIRGGERLAVVGLNGAGKTTMIKLLLRLYRPTSGRILLNGEDIQSFNRDSYYRTFAPVFQEVLLFALSLRQNISMKREEESDRELAEKCVREAGMSEKLDALPNGMDTQVLKVVYDDGVDFSGGEKQKLALARALYKEAPVVVLDEPTAALDAIAEAKLYESFDRLIGGKTAVYISHRLSSTQFCSHVAMFADGEMKEYGTHEELMAKGGAYAELFHVQAQYYVENGEEASANV